MLTSLLLLVVEAVVGFFTVLLLARFYMQWLRVSFRNQLGQFVVALTDWMVRPARRLIPGLFGLDLASFAPAWALQSGQFLLYVSLKGSQFSAGIPAAVGAVMIVGLLETTRLSIYLLIAVLIVAAVLSWVNPYSPLAPFFNSLSRPFLRPLQRVIPPVANVDLSPLVLLLVLQIVLVLLGYVRGSIQVLAM